MIHSIILYLIWIIFIIQIGPQHPETQHVAISHHGLRLIKRTPNGDLVILETLPLEEIVSVSSPRIGVCVMQIASGVRLPLHTNRAPQLTEMISSYIRMVSDNNCLISSFISWQIEKFVTRNYYLSFDLIQFFQRNGIHNLE